MNKLLQTLLCFLLILLFARSALAHRVVGCEPEWAALAKEIGGEMVTVSSATTGRQNPHHIEARPSLIAMVRNADILICTGLGVEGGWLPILLANSGNPRIQPGEPGYLEAGNYVQKLDVPTSLDRAQGDVHALGNHHIQNNLYNVLLIAEVLAKRLAEINPPNAAYYQARYKAFSGRWTDAIKRWEMQAAPLKGVGESLTKIQSTQNPVHPRKLAKSSSPSFRFDSLSQTGSLSKYPPAKPGALGDERLKGA